VQGQGQHFKTVKSCLASAIPPFSLTTTTFLSSNPLVTSFDTGQNKTGLSIPTDLRPKPELGSASVAPCPAQNQQTVGLLFLCVALDTPSKLRDWSFSPFYTGTLFFLSKVIALKPHGDALTYRHFPKGALGKYYFSFLANHHPNTHFLPSSKEERLLCQRQHEQLRVSRTCSFLSLVVTVWSKQKKERERFRGEESIGVSTGGGLQGGA